MGTGQKHKMSSLGNSLDSDNVIRMTIDLGFFHDLVIFQHICDGNFDLQIVECNALPTLILMLWSEDATIHYEAVGTYP